MANERKEVHTKNRVVITGIGVVSSAGIGPDRLAEALREGRSSVRIIDSFPEEMPCRIGAPVPDFDPSKYLSSKYLRRMDLSVQFLAASAVMAIEDGGINKADIDKRKIGLFEGTSMGGLSTALREHANFLEKGYHHISPFTLNSAMTGIGGSVVSLMYGFKGPNMTFSNGRYIVGLCPDRGAGANSFRYN